MNDKARVLWSDRLTKAGLLLHLSVIKGKSKIYKKLSFLQADTRGQGRLILSVNCYMIFLAKIYIVEIMGS